jgi:hypothetical protein
VTEDERQEWNAAVEAAEADPAPANKARVAALRERHLTAINRKINEETLAEAETDGA